MISARLGKLRFKSLQILLLAKELGSLRAVAEAVSTSQPAVTQSLQELEKALGQTLLSRNHNGVGLTPAGELLAARAKVALEEMRVAAESVKGRSGVPVLRLGVLPFLMFDLIPNVVRYLAESETPLRLDIHETYVQRLRERLLAGDDDLVLTRLAAAAVDAEQYPSIRIRDIADDTVTVFVGARHPLYADARRHRAVDPKQLADCAWALPPIGTEVRQHVDELLVFNGLPPSIPSVETRSLHSMLMIVGASHAVSAGPLSAVLRMTELLKLAPLKLRKVRPTTMHTVAMYHARQDHNPAVRVFLESLAQARDAAAQGG